MRFLFNDVLLDIKDPQASLAETGCPIGGGSVDALEPGDVIALVQEVVFSSPAFPRRRPEKAMALACLVHLKTKANALLCIRPAGASSPRDMQVRLAHMSLTVLGDLVRRHAEGVLTVEAIDNAVWAAA